MKGSEGECPLFHEVRVAACNDGGLGAVASCAGHLYIEFFGDAFLQGDVDPVFFNEAFTFLKCLGRQVFQHLQLVLALANQCAQGNGYGQANHTRAGNTHAHSILQDVCTQPDRDMLGSAT